MNGLVSFLMISLLSCISLEASAQARIMINNDAYITMDGSIYIVLDNPNANAISTLGTGGNIVSEDENSKVRWNIGTNTGNYVIPFYSGYNAAGMKIPLTFTVTGAATGAAGRVDFSTYKTPDGATGDENDPWPSMVTHLLDANTATVNNETYVVDRFWVLNANNYTTRPDVSLTFTYDNSAGEIGNGNALAEGALVAQRFNSGLNTWQGLPGGGGSFFGTVNTGTRTVGPFAISNADLFEAWTLVDNNNLLPVEMLMIETQCKGTDNLIQWVTASEANNDYFSVQRSLDGMYYVEIARVQGAGNSSSPVNYQYLDNTAPSQVVFYKIVQVDQNGSSKSYDPLIATCGAEGTDIIGQTYENGQINFQIQSGENQDLDIDIYDAGGKLIYSKSKSFNKGVSNLGLNNSDLATGIYLISLKGQNTNIVRKIFVP